MKSARENLRAQEENIPGRTKWGAEWMGSRRTQPQSHSLDVWSFSLTWVFHSTRTFLKKPKILPRKMKLTKKQAVGYDVFSISFSIASIFNQRNFKCTSILCLLYVNCFLDDFVKWKTPCFTVLIYSHHLVSKYGKYRLAQLGMGEHFLLPGSFKDYVQWTVGISQWWWTQWKCSFFSSEHELWEIATIYLLWMPFLWALWNELQLLYDYPASDDTATPD